MDLSIAFLTGLTSGGISCFAVQGGLLTSISTKKKDVLFFLIAKLISYTLLGFFLGLLGSALNITPRIRGTLQILVGLFMLTTAARILNIHPFFKYFSLKPSKSVFKVLKNQTLPLILGALTILIPCGLTSGMMLLAVAGNNPVWGAGLMFFFTLGTLPVFFLIGLSTIEFLKKKVFSVIAAVFIISMGIISINGGQILRGSVHTIQNYWKALIGSTQEVKNAVFKSGFQEVTIYVTNTGYKSDINTLKIGVPVRLTLISDNTRNCTRSFSIPSLNYFKLLPVSGKEVVEFTPDKLGSLIYTCSMGMYTGLFNVTE
jgi:sulfite exporter TauE/SafE